MGMHFQPTLSDVKGGPLLDAYTTERILRALANAVALAEKAVRDARPTIPRDGIPDRDEVARYSRLVTEAMCAERAFRTAYETTSGEGRYDRGVPDTFARSLLKGARQTHGVIGKGA